VKIYIPTHKRYNRQITWRGLPPSVQADTKLVISSGETPHYAQGLPLLETPPEVQGIGATRQWILDNAEGNHIVMLDDDLTFARRRLDDPSRFVPASVLDMEKWHHDMDNHLNSYAHVSMGPRENGNRKTDLYYECGRAMRVLAFDLEVLRREGVRFNPELVQDDFDITLQLLKKGYQNLIVGWMVHNQSGSGAAGGASEYRDIAKHNESIKKLAALHPGLVTVVTKHTKVAWGGQPRLDVICQWKKAYTTSTTGLKNANKSV
jgi:hypothetical protein